MRRDNATINAFRAVAVRCIEPYEAARALRYVDNARPWLRFVCLLIGHREGVRVPLDPIAMRWPWMCPRCGALHRVIGGILPPEWS